MLYASPGVYPYIDDRSFMVSGSGLISGGIVLTSERGPTERTTVSSLHQFVELYGLPTSDNPTKWAAFRYLSRARILSIVRVINDAETASGVSNDPEGKLRVYAANPGAWGNTLTVAFSDSMEDDTLFFIHVYENGKEVEKYLVSEDPARKDGFGNNIYLVDRIALRSNRIRVEHDHSVTDPLDRGQVITLTNGADDTAPVSMGKIMQGWDEFENADEIPATLLINGGFASPAIHAKIDSISHKRQDGIAILDFPRDVTDNVQHCIDYVNHDLGIDSFQSAIYSSWIRIYDQFQDKEMIIPPSGDIAANIVQAISNAGLWQAAAGVIHGVIPNALGVSTVFKLGDRDLLYPQRINPVTSHAGSNCIIWGIRTLQKARSARSYVQIVIFLNVLKQQLRQALKPYLFAPNRGETTWENVRFMIDSYMENIKTRGGVYDYRTVVDETNNTPYDIDSGVMNVDVYLKPTRAVEFIRLNLIVTSTGVDLGRVDGN